MTLIESFKPKIDKLTKELKKGKIVKNSILNWIWIVISRIWSSSDRSINPVKRKAYRIILGRLIAIREGLIQMEIAGSIDPGLEATMQDILNSIDTNLPDASVWDIMDALKELLPRVVTIESLHKLLIDEKARQKEEGNLWSDYYGSRSLDKQIDLLEKKTSSYDRELASKRLASLYAIRNDIGRHDRAREGIRVKYLVRMAWILLFSIFALIYLWDYSEGREDFGLFLFIGAVSGAIGALLSRALRLRNLSLITEINTLYYTLFLQAVLGGIMALIVLLILKTGLVEINGIDIESKKVIVFFVIGLISGFSEPFALGIIEKIAKKGKEEET